MDRLAARLAEVDKPLRKGEFAALFGCSVSYVRKLASAGTIATVQSSPVETRIPVTEAVRLAREWRLLK